MKKHAFAFLIIGFIIGAIAGRLTTKRPVIKNENVAVQEEREKALGNLYPAGVGLRVVKDMRVLTLLNSNDIAMSKSLLLQDLDINVSSLAMLSRETQLDDFNKKALRDGEQFLEAAKK